MNIDTNTTLTSGDLLQLLGYIISGIAVYVGIRVDLARMHDKHEANVKALAETKEIAISAHTKLYDHVIDLHADQDRRHPR